jgi:transposase-like protein
MARGIMVAPEIKEIIIGRVKSGDHIDDLAKEFNLYPNTIRKWLAQDGVSGTHISSSGKTRNNQSLALLLAKSEREKQDLYKIIGELTVQYKELVKKKYKQN